MAVVAFKAAPATDGPQPPVATKFLDFFDRLRAAEGDHQPISFMFSETEVNDYLRYSLRNTPRPGIDSLTVKFFPNDYISTYTRVDWEAVEQWRKGTIPAIMRPMLKGKKAVWIDFRIHADGGQMTFTVEKAKYDDVALSTVFVEKMIQIVASKQPENYDTSNPISLPFGVKKISTTEHNVRGNN